MWSFFFRRMSVIEPTQHDRAFTTTMVWSLLSHDIVLMDTTHSFNTVQTRLRHFRATVRRESLFLKLLQSWFLYLAYQSHKNTPLYCTSHVCWDLNVQLLGFRILPVQTQFRMAPENPPLAGNQKGSFVELCYILLISWVVRNDSTTEGHIDVSVEC